MKHRLFICSLAVMLGLLLAVVRVFGDSPKPAYKVTRLSLNDAAISCKSGKPPLVDTRTDGTYIVVTCE